MREPQRLCTTCRGGGGGCWGGLGLLETLTYMEANTEEFSLAELRSFYHMMTEMRKLFQPKVVDTAAV